MLQSQLDHGKILPVKGGWLICPICRRNHRLQRISPDMTASRFPVYCKDCKSEILIDVDRGQCFESRSQ